MEVFMQMKEISLYGNVIDNGWVENLRYSSGAPNMNAIMILSEIVYWYRPVEIRDESTGEVRGYKKKFRADKLQKSYQAMGKRFGLSKRQVKEACDFLRDKGIITVEFRVIRTETGVLPNVMFLEPVMENLKKITGINRVVDDNVDDNNETFTKEDFTSVGYPTFKRRIPYVQTEDTLRSNVGHIHRLTTEITTENNNSTTTEISAKEEITNVVVENAKEAIIETNAVVENANGEKKRTIVGSSIKNYIDYNIETAAKAIVKKTNDADAVSDVRNIVKQIQSITNTERVRIDGLRSVLTMPDGIERLQKAVQHYPQLAQDVKIKNPIGFLCYIATNNIVPPEKKNSGCSLVKKVDFAKFPQHVYEKDLDRLFELIE